MALESNNRLPEILNIAVLPTDYMQIFFPYKTRYLLDVCFMSFLEQNINTEYKLPKFTKIRIPKGPRQQDMTHKFKSKPTTEVNL